MNPNEIWRETKAPQTGRIYYYKKSTRETTWSKPAVYIPIGGSGPVSGATGEPIGPSAAVAAPVAAPVATPETLNATPTPVSPATPEPSPAVTNPAVVSTPTPTTTSTQPTHSTSLSLSHPRRFQAHNALVHYFFHLRAAPLLLREPGRRHHHRTRDDFSKLCGGEHPKPEGPFF